MLVFELVVAAKRIKDPVLRANLAEKIHYVSQLEICNSQVSQQKVLRAQKAAQCVYFRVASFVVVSVEVEVAFLGYTCLDIW